MDKTVIVTGASRGIGSETARAFALAGYRVVINYNSSHDSAMRLKNELTKENPCVEIFKADVSRRGDVDDMVDFCIKKFGGVDILINNAGVARTEVFTDITEEGWDEIMSVNLKGVFNCSQSVLKYMINKKSGNIINISSVWGIVGASCEVHYSAAKAGVIGLTKALAKELAPSGIVVNCIAPGIIDTYMIKNLSKDETDDLVSGIPLGRLGTGRDIAKCALFLAQSSYITGQVISPNGGFVI
ncbi:MAG: 3-oxoacyl-(acyl-carrier-protein) reductase FabG [Firmicutes bacterium ADurb.Bin193]|nr:MAG: 3-oxoacyl-(acyl-carrier-protein) reductase FabG [Firmicutes bacterium ADurb.Bin193]